MGYQQENQVLKAKAEASSREYDELVKQMKAITLTMQGLMVDLEEAKRENVQLKDVFNENLMLKQENEELKRQIESLTKKPHQSHLLQDISNLRIKYEQLWESTVPPADLTFFVNFW